MVDNAMADAVDDSMPEEILQMGTDDIVRRTRLLDNEIRILKDESTRLNLEQNGLKEKIRENKEKIKLNNQLPYLVGNIVELLDINPDAEEEEDGANVDLDSQRKGNCVVLKTSTRQTIFLPVVGLVDPAKLRYDGGAVLGAPTPHASVSTPYASVSTPNHPATGPATSWA